MEKKIDISELLKDCPKGMEFDCVLYNDVVLHEVHLDNRAFPIVFLRTTNGDTFVTTKYGEYSNTKDSKCIIFPKGKTTWEGFVSPCKFKNGDIISDGNYIAIFYKIGTPCHCTSPNVVYYHCYYSQKFCTFKNKLDYGIGVSTAFKYATEEEKEKLFQAIRHSGYYWNHETKTLEKTNDLKFKIGDRITNGIVTGKIRSRDVDSYQLDNGVFVLFSVLEKWKLDTSKFDITALKPFDKVLVRDFDNGLWEIDFFSRLLNGEHFKCLDLSYVQCIPYEGNEHLLGTKDDCDEFYKTWEE